MLYLWFSLDDADDGGAVYLHSIPSYSVHEDAKDVIITS